MMTAFAARAVPPDQLNRRLGLGLLLSLLLHGLVLSLQFGVPGWKAGREARITVALAPAPLTPPPAAEKPVAAPAVPAPSPEAAPAAPVPPAPGFRLLEPAAPAPPQPRPEPARRSAKPRRRPVKAKPAPPYLSEAVIAQERSAASRFVVPPAPLTDLLSEPVDAARQETAPEAGASGQVDEAARQLALENEARRAADEQVQRLAEERALAAQEEAARQERVRIAQEEAARQELMRMQAQRDEAARREQEALAARRQAEEEDRRVAAARAEQARQLAQAEARRLAEDEARRLADAQRRAQELLAAQEQERQAALLRQQQEALARQQAEQLALRRQAEAEAQLRKAAELAAQREAQLAREQAERLARERAEEQLAERRRLDELARQAARQQAGQDRAREATLAAAPAIGQTAAGTGSGIPGDGEGGGRADAPRRLAPGELASRAREIARGIDLLRSVPPAVRPAEEAQAGRRRVVSTGADGDVPLRMYIDSFRQKIERNAALVGAQLGVARVRIDPLVSVALRSDGSVDEVTILRSSGRADTDEAVRRIVRLNARYAAFPPNVAARYDVIEIRRIWSFAETLKLLEELR